MRLVTWNLNGLDDVAVDEHAEAAVFTSILGARLDQLQHGTRPSAPPQVLMFQEVVPRTFAAHLNPHLSAGGYRLFPAEAPEKETFEVIAVAEGVVVESYRSVALQRSKYGRMLHIADLAVPDGETSKPMQVLTAHFDGGSEAGAVRSAQLRQVAKAIAANGIFAGDANLRKAEWESARDSLGVSDAWEALGEPASTRFTWRRDEYKARFDRILLGNGVDAQRLSALGTSALPGGPMISDHIGLALDFTV